MRVILIMFICLFPCGIYSQDHDNCKTIDNSHLCRIEVEQLSKLFQKESKIYDFRYMKFAFVGGTSGNIIYTKADFFNLYVLPVINDKKKNVCGFIIFNPKEKKESGGYDAIILSPVKIFTATNRKNLLVYLNKTVR